MLLLSVAGLASSLASTASCGTPTEVRAVYTALDSNGDRRRTHFYTDTDSIFCDVDYVGDRKDITVNAVLRQVTSEPCPFAYYPNPLSCPGGDARQTSWAAPQQSANFVLSVLEQTPGSGTTTLGFSWQQQTSSDTDAGSSTSGGNSTPPPPWPVGKYRCEIYVDGAMQGSADFDVGFPDGDANHIAGQAYKGQGACPVTPVLAGNPCWDYVLPGQQCLSGIGKTCACDKASGVWVCP